MKVDESTLHLAGFALAHAAWSVSDLPAGGLLCPLAFVDESGGRKLRRFEAETQEQAIGDALIALEAEKATASAWAFVREGIFRNGEEKFDELVMVVWDRGMTEPLYFTQRFEPFATRGQFKILGEIEILNVKGSVDGSRILTAGLREGILQHPKVAALWSQWKASNAA